MTVYLDVLFLVNSLSDCLGLYITARLAGLMLHWKRILAAAGLGGLYGVVCGVIPGPYGGILPQTLVAAGMVRLAYGRREKSLRLLMLFFLVSCAMAGVPMALLRLSQEGGGLDALRNMNWKIFFLAGTICYAVLSLMFRGGAKHGLSGQLCHGSVLRNGKEADVTALYDTGHTLRDMISGSPVLVAELRALVTLWTEAELAILDELPVMGPAWCMERLEPGRFTLLPYRAVGVSGGLLLCFKADSVAIDGQLMGPLTVAISPTPVSEGGGYAALWGGERRPSHAA